MKTPPRSLGKTGLRKSGKAQSNEMVMAREEKQGREQGNGWQRTKETLWWERDRSSASTSQNKALIWKKEMQMSRGMEQRGDE